MTHYHYQVHVSPMVDMQVSCSLGKKKKNREQKRVWTADSAERDKDPFVNRGGKKLNMYTRNGSCFTGKAHKKRKNENEVNQTAVDIQGSNFSHVHVQ